MDTPVEILKDHESRIGKLEASQQMIEANLEKMRSSLDIYEAKSKTRSELLMMQNESLMRQNERQGTQLDNVLGIVVETKDKDAIREHELKRVRTTSRLQLAGYILGGGGLITILLEILRTMIAN